MKRALRGTTLLELLIAVGVLGVAMVAASTLVMATGRMVRNNQEISDSNDGSRVGGEAIAKSLEIGGLGSGQGLWVAGLANLPTKVNAIFGTDGINAPDDLWVVVPLVDGMQPSYAAAVNGAPVKSGGIVTAPWTTGGALSVSNTNNLGLSGGPAAQFHLVTNLNSAALLTPTAVGASTPTTSGTILFNESPHNVTDSPERGGFQVGDLVMEAQIFHYFIGPTPSGSVGLFRELGKVEWDGTGLGKPFKPQLGLPPQLLQDNVEDFQVGYGFEDPLNVGNPSRYIFQDGLPALFTPGLRAVRITVVALSKQPIKDESGRLVASALEQVGVPLAIENHAPPMGPIPNEGYRRSVYRRRIETVNLAPSML